MEQNLKKIVGPLQLKCKINYQKHNFKWSFNHFVLNQQHMISGIKHN